MRDGVRARTPATVPHVPPSAQPSSLSWHRTSYSGPIAACISSPAGGRSGDLPSAAASREKPSKCSGVGSRLALHTQDATVRALPTPDAGEAHLPVEDREVAAF